MPDASWPPPAPLLHAQGDLFAPERLEQLTDADRHQQRLWFALMGQATKGRSLPELSSVISEARRQLESPVLVRSIERIAVKRAETVGVKVGGDPDVLIKRAEPYVVADREDNPFETPFERAVNRLLNRGADEAQAIMGAMRKWPDSRQVTIMVFRPERRTRDRVARWLRHLAKEGVVVDFEYLSRKRLQSMAAVPRQSTPRFEVMVRDQLTELPWNRLKDVEIDAYDEDWRGGR